MTILIVDDQISVVSGLFSGIDWKKIGIQKVLKAYSANEAKEIFKRHDIDILLCDIEMPVEDGISLLTWVRDYNYDTECIFLTAHADFIYAKEAIRLGSFDYILQPARYEDIEKDIEKLSRKIQVRRKKEEMAYCGDMIQNRKTAFMNMILHNFLMEIGDLQREAIRDLQNLNIRIQENEKTYVAYLVFQKDKEVFGGWEPDLIRFVINNILEELFVSYGYGLLLFEKSREEYIAYFYQKEFCTIEKEIVIRQLQYFLELYRQYNSCWVVCYVTSCENVADINKSIRKLEVLKENDVTREGKVVDEEEKNESETGYERLRKYVAEIEPLLANELYEKISDDIIAVIDELASERRINGETLKCFYQDFLSVIHTAAGKHGKILSEIFDGEEDRERSLKAYQSLDEMKWFVKYTMAALNEMSTSDEKQKSQIDSICQYIRSNMERDIKRNDIAEWVHLNPNYVSRLFKKEIGVSLKEYIMNEKMKLAKELVRNTNLPIGVITMKVGYSNFSYFAQVYKKMNGFSPTEDREINGKAK